MVDYDKHTKTLQLKSKLGPDEIEHYKDMVNKNIYKAVYYPDDTDGNITEQCISRDEVTGVAELYG